MITEIVRNNKVLLKKVQELSKEVGNTPLLPLTHIFRKKNVQLFAKQEWKQLSGSVKCRPAFQIIKDAILNYELDEDMTLLDATSGNTGIAYASIGQRLGIKVTLCLPENASKERKEILRSLGAEIILTSKFEGTDGAQQVARELAASDPDKYFYADQYKNENNWKAHYETTAIEIFEALPRITHFVTGLGTSGTFVGVGRRLKELNPSIQLISLQPDSAMHALEGWKHLETAIVPGIYDPTLADASAEVSTEESYEYVKAIVKHEGWLVSPSAAANVAGAIRVANQLQSGIVVTVLPDNADKYGDVIKKYYSMIILHENVNEEMTADALTAFPDECCGFLFGEEEGDERIITAIQVVNNAKEGDKRRRFSIAPLDYLRAERFAETNGVKLLGVYHSHPGHPAIPSEHDRVAAQPYFSYLIISVLQGQWANTRSWVLNEEQQFEEETINHYQLIK